MSDLASAVFVLRPTRPFEKRQFMGRAAHKLFLLLAALDAPASDGPYAALPVTVSDLFQNDAAHYWLRVMALEPALAETLAHMVQALPNRAVVDGWQVVFGLLGSRDWARQTTLAGITGSEKGITYTTDTMDRLTVSGGKSDPRGGSSHAQGCH